MQIDSIYRNVHIELLPFSCVLFSPLFYFNFIWRPWMLSTLVSWKRKKERKNKKIRSKKQVMKLSELDAGTERKYTKRAAHTQHKTRRICCHWRAKRRSPHVHWSAEFFKNYIYHSARNRRECIYIRRERERVPGSFSLPQHSFEVRQLAAARTAPPAIYYSWKRMGKENRRSEPKQRAYTGSHQEKKKQKKKRKKKEREREKIANETAKINNSYSLGQSHTHHRV